MLKEVLNYIKFDYKNCINHIIGIKLNFKSKTIIITGPKERYVMDGFNLEGFIKDISGYNYVVEIIDHFSKFLKSYAISENNATNILIYLKDFCYYIGMPKILQTDNWTKYKNTILKEFCNTNNINHIFFTSTSSD